MPDPSSPTPTPRSPLRILLVDDEETLRETTADLLRGDGYLVDTAGDGGESIDMLKANAYDLMLSDILMPGNANLDLVRCIREVDPDLPIILITGYPSVGTAVEALNLSVKAYLTKPLDYGALLAELRRIEEGIHTRRLLKTSQDRLLGWVGDMDRIQQMVRQSRTFLDRDSAREVLALSLGNIAGVLLDMKTLFELTLRPEEAQDLCELRQCPRLEAMSSGLREAIRVLEHTKGSFKSKELGQLRTDLERLVGTSNPAR